MSDKAASSRTREPKGGTVVAGRYQIDRLIARGGMAAVYLAHQVKLNRPVALKILTPPPDAEDNAAFEERFRLEAETLASLDHENIVTLHDFGELDDGRFFLAMEFVDGPRVSDLLKNGPLSVERALQLTSQIVNALRYAHKRGVVHRDLKPSNLLVRTRDDGSEQVKVVDFGLVKLTENDQTITRAGLILGSPHCMSPEQVKGHDVDHRADIYAIGVLMFRVITGEYPFHGSNSAATMIAHLNQNIPPFFRVAPDLVVPEGLEAMVRTCLAKEREDRYADTSALLADMALCMEAPPDHMRSVTQSTSTIQSAIVRQPDMVPNRRPNLMVWIPVAVGIMLVLLFAVALLSSAVTTLIAMDTRSPQVKPLPDVVLTAPDDPKPFLTPEELAKPLPQPVDEPEPVVVEEPEPIVVAEPVPVAPPPTPVRPRNPPEPVEAPAPPPVPDPAPDPTPPTPEPSETPEPKGPEGYMGLPEDLQ